MQAKLVVVGGTTKNQEIKLRLPTIIGRGRSCTLQLPHPLVSRQHCEVFERDGKLLVRDLGSLNGTFIGSQKITEAELPAGSLLVVGTVTFRVEYCPEQPSATTEEVPETVQPSVTSVRQPARPAAVPFAVPIPVGPTTNTDNEPLADFADQASPRSSTPAHAPFATPVPPADHESSETSSEFAAEEFHEDAVEVVEDSSNLLPPPAAPIAPVRTAPAAETPPSRETPAKPSAKIPSDSEADLAAFLKSLEK